jgi:hypothetical protein
VTYPLTPPSLSLPPPPTLTHEPTTSEQPYAIKLSSCILQMHGHRISIQNYSIQFDLFVKFVCLYKSLISCLRIAKYVVCVCRPVLIKISMMHCAVPSFLTGSNKTELPYTDANVSLSNRNLTDRPQSTCLRLLNASGKNVFHGSTRFPHVFLTTLYNPLVMMLIANRSMLYA